MNEIEKKKALAKAEALFSKAERLRKQIIWHNDAQRDSLLTKIDKLLFEANWLYIEAKGV